LYDRSNISQV